MTTEDVLHRNECKVLYMDRMAIEFPIRWRNLELLSHSNSELSSCEHEVWNPSLRDSGFEARTNTLCSHNDNSELEKDNNSKLRHLLGNLIGILSMYNTLYLF